MSHSYTSIFDNKEDQISIRDIKDELFKTHRRGSNNSLWCLFNRLMEKAREMERQLEIVQSRQSELYDRINNLRRDTVEHPHSWIDVPTNMSDGRCIRCGTHRTSYEIGSECPVPEVIHIEKKRRPK